MRRMAELHDLTVEALSELLSTRDFEPSVES